MHGFHAPSSSHYALSIFCFLTNNNNTFTSLLELHKIPLGQESLAYFLYKFKDETEDIIKINNHFTPGI